MAVLGRDRCPDCGAFLAQCGLDDTTCANARCKSSWQAARRQFETSLLGAAVRQHEAEGRIARMLMRNAERCAMPRWPADHIRRPEPDHTHADLRVGRQWLAEQADLYVPARVLMERVEAMEADLARIPVGTLSKHKTHRWTGRHWKEIDA